MAQWYGVRCVFADGDGVFEERVTVWQADGFEAAVLLAEAEADDYADDEDLEYLGFAQASRLSSPPGHGAEVFVLERESDLDPEDYLTEFFDTGTEDEDVLDDDEDDETD